METALDKYTQGHWERSHHLQLWPSIAKPDDSYWEGPFKPAVLSSSHRMHMTFVYPWGHTLSSLLKQRCEQLEPGSLSATVTWEVWRGKNLKALALPLRPCSSGLAASCPATQGHLGSLITTSCIIFPILWSHGCSYNLIYFTFSSPERGKLCITFFYLHMIWIVFPSKNLYVEALTPNVTKNCFWRDN